MLALGSMTRLSPDESLAELRKVKEHILSLSLRVPIRADFIVHGHNISLSIFRLFEAAERAEAEVDALINAKRSLDTSTHDNASEVANGLAGQPGVHIPDPTQLLNSGQTSVTPPSGYSPATQDYLAQASHPQGHMGQVAHPQTSPAPVYAEQIHQMPIQGVPVQNIPIQSVPVQSVPVQSVPVHAIPVHDGSNQMIHTQLAQSSTTTQTPAVQISDTHIPIVQAGSPQSHQAIYPDDSVAISYESTPSGYQTPHEETRPSEPAQRRPMTTTGLRLRQAIQRSHDTASRTPTGAHAQPPSSAITTSGQVDSTTISTQPPAAIGSVSNGDGQNDEGVFQGGDEEFDL